MSMIQVLVYVVLLTLISTSLIAFTINLLERSNASRTTIATLDNARGALNVMKSAIRQAEAVYTPTSSLGSHPGQLSLVTLQNPPTDENQTYIDFYLDDERLYRKQEGSAAEQITSEQIRITSLTFNQLNNASPSDVVQVSLTAVPANATGTVLAESTITLTTTISMKTY